MGVEKGGDSTTKSSESAAAAESGCRCGDSPLLLAPRVQTCRRGCRQGNSRVPRPQVVRLRRCHIRDGFLQELDDFLPLLGVLSHPPLPLVVRELRFVVA